MAVKTDEGWIFSAHDLISQFECQHRVRLNLSSRLGLIEKPKSDDANLELLKELGQLFEQRRLNDLEKTTRVIKLPMPNHGRAGYQAAWLETKAAMEAEAPVIYQATLFDGRFVGIVDFLLLRIDHLGEIERDEAGRAIYEPVDTKSARSEKVSAVIQVGAYASLLVRLGWPKPKQVHIWLAGEKNWSGEASKAMAVAVEIENELLKATTAETSLPEPIWAEPRPSCSICEWAPICEAGRRTSRDLSLIQGIRSTTRQRLVQADIHTIDQMASADDEDRPARVGEQTFSNLRAQADIQLRAEQQGQVLAESISDLELSRYPHPSPGDIWFDMEGDPYADDGQGLEYMFGFVFLDGEKQEFKTFDALSLDEEQQAFEDFIDFVMKRWRAYPDLHIYHYADYERRAILRLSQKYNSKVAEVDAILRGGLLIDMFSLIRKSIRFSTESLSLKYVEEIYGVSHGAEDVQSAKDSIVAFHAVRALLDQNQPEAAERAYEEIRSYNQKDCESTYDFDRWIRKFAVQHGFELGQTAVAGEGEVAEPSDNELLSRKLGELLDSSTDMSEADRVAISLLRGALLFHERENKVAWWRVFDAVEQDLEVLGRQTGALVIGDLTVGEWHKTPRAKKHRRELVVSGIDIAAEDALAGEKSVVLIYEFAEPGMMSQSGGLRGFSRNCEIDDFVDGRALITEKSGDDDAFWDAQPIAVMRVAQYATGTLQAAIAQLAEEVLSTGGVPNRAWSALLKRVVPEGLTHSGAGDQENIIATLLASTDACVAVQGPPGTGKTFVGSRVVAALAKQGWRIGVVGQSHAVVENLIEKVIEVDSSVAVGKQPKDAQGRAWEVTSGSDWAASQPAGFVLGGTAWTFASVKLWGLGLDLLVVDEAGQFSITMTLASAVGAKRILLLGDPQQLPQVSQASHPEGAEVSALEHYSAGSNTLSSEVGFFLETTFRMHPALTEKVSALQYEGRLASSPSVLVRNLEGVTPGLIPMPVNHFGNTTRSDEEAAEIVSIAKELIGKTWTGNKGGSPAPPTALNESDLIVVAAFNDQVRTVRRHLKVAGLGDVRVGTVDKFQGQEAVIVIVSMATSSDEDLPRGVDFLLSPNRLNVAVSRGQWACYLVYSPELRGITPASVPGLMSLGGFLELVR